MSRALYLYSHLSLTAVEKIISEHQEDFDEVLEEEFSSEEQENFADMIDAIGAISAQPLISELSFDDFEADPEEEAKQRFFFEHTKSTVILENLPELGENPFQVTYLLMLIERFPELLIDWGFTSELQFKDRFLQELRSYRQLGALAKRTQEYVARPTPKQRSAIDFIVDDVYRELNRINSQAKNELIDLERSSLPEKMQRVLSAFESGVWTAEVLLAKSQQNPKDFGDNLERVKFFLKRLV